MKRKNYHYNKSSYSYQKQIGHKDNRTVYNNKAVKKDTYYDKEITASERAEYSPVVRVPKLKRKTAWKRFYRLFPSLKGKKQITGYSTCSAMQHINSSTIKLKRPKKKK